MAAATFKGTIIVTGANGGLGSAVAEQIASKPDLSAHHGIYAVREATAAPDLAAALARGEASHQHDVVSLDLTDLEHVRLVAANINDRVSAGKIPPIRALILAAGFQDFGKQSWTADGFDTTFAANYLGHWLLSLLLLKSMDKEAGRIVVIGSQGHDTRDPRNARTKAFVGEYESIAPNDVASFEAIAKGTWSSAAEDASFRGGFRRYSASKLFLVMMIHELQERLDQDVALNNVSVLGVDPGTMISGLQRLAPWFIRVLLFKVIYPLILALNRGGETIRASDRSAVDVLEAAVGAIGDQGLRPKNLYFDGRTLLDTSAESKDVEKRRLVWTETVKCSGLRDGDTILANWR